jgi:ribonuclease HI
MDKTINFENLPKDTIIIYCDGSCNWENKFGGYGVLLIDNKKEKLEIFFGEKETTIGRMELLGIITSLRLLQDNEKAVIYCDSEYAVNCINKNWLEDWSVFLFAGKKNSDLLKIYLEEYNRFSKGNIVIKHIKGHVGFEGNEIADKLAKKGYNQIKKFVNSQKN